MPMDSKPSTGPHVAVVGAGIGGLATAAFLFRAGISCTVYEQAKELKEVGAGLVLAPNAGRLLRRLGVLDGLQDVVVPLDVGWEFRRWRDGRVLSAENLEGACEELYGERTYTVHRADLLNTLVSAVPADTMRLGQRCTGVAVGDAGARLDFEDGSAATADVVVGADGVHSMLRGVVADPLPATYSGICAFRGIVPVDRAPEFARRRAQTLWVGPDHHLVHYPISAGRAINLVAFAPARDYMLESWSATATVEEFLAEFAGWDPRLQDLIRGTGTPGRWALLDREPLQSWSRGPITLLGDAAHPMFPFFAQGAAQAIEDAAVLVRCLREDLDDPVRALRRYESLRIGRTARLQEVSHARAHVNHLPDGPEQQSRDVSLAAVDPLVASGWIYSYDPDAAADGATSDDGSPTRRGDPATTSPPSASPVRLTQRGTAAMITQQKFRSLQDLVDATPDLVGYLYNDTPGPHSRIRSDLNPVPVEFSNWRDEQRAWRETAILFDQSHHMPELFLTGPDAFALLNHIGVNSLANLNPGLAKQLVGCNPRGQIIGDCILYDLGEVDGEQTYELVSSTPLLNWIEYHAQTGDWDVSVRRDNNTSDNPTGKRDRFRFQLDGPAATEIFDEVVEGDIPEIKFFHTARVTIADVEVLVLRHGMAGHKGVELSGAYEDGERVRQAILDAGTKHGLRQGGTKAYFSTLYEQAWVAYPLPAVYTGEDLRAYREWLPADSWEGKFSIAGSFVSSDIEDYYVTPFDLGYGRIVKFDHDFIGREALVQLAANPPRQKMTLVWNTEDVLRIVGSLLEPGVPFKYLDLPIADYGNMQQRDEVRALDGTFIGLSTFSGYSINERKMLSLALIATEHAIPGTEVTLLWGEPDGGSRKPRVELHQQTLVRATVAQAPYAAAVQKMMRSSVESSTSVDHSGRLVPSPPQGEPSR